MKEKTQKNNMGISSPNAEQNEFLSAYDQYSKGIFRHIYIRVSNRHLAEDLTSETFLKSWNYIAEGRKINNIKAFLYQIANNLIIDHYRGKSKEAMQIDETFDIPDNADPIEDKLDKKISMESVAKNIESLTEDYKQILIYRYVDELDILEIKKITGKSMGSIYVTIHRALKSLKKIILNKKNEQANKKIFKKA